MSVRPEDRLTSLDLIRGVAVLCILPANLPWFVGPQVGGQSLFDRIAAAVVLLVIDAKMVTALAILFGAGLGLQEAKARERDDETFAGRYLWRQFLLLLLGLSHGLFIWFGDILATYALIGSVALFLVLLGSDWVRWTTFGGLAWFYGVLFGGALLLTGGVVQSPSPQEEVGNTDGPPVSLVSGSQSFADRAEAYFRPANEVRIYRNGTFADRTEHRIYFVVASLFALPFFMGWYLLACFLLGMQLLWAGAFHPGERRRWLLQLFLMLGVTVGVPCHIAAVALSFVWPGTAWSAILNLVGALPQSLMYIGLLLAWDEGNVWTGLRGRLRAVGRMALTNYLLQSVLLGLVFYGHGLGLYGQTGLAVAMPLVPILWGLQLWWSPVWLHLFSAGPVEWVWRSLATGRMQPILAGASS